MALIKCPECNGQISDKAKICPNCSYPVQNEQVKIKSKKIWKKIRKKIIVGIISILVIYILWTIISFIIYKNEVNSVLGKTFHGKFTVPYYKTSEEYEFNFIDNNKCMVNYKDCTYTIKYDFESLIPRDNFYIFVKLDSEKDIFFVCGEAAIDFYYDHGKIAGIHHWAGLLSLE